MCIVAAELEPEQAPGGCARGRPGAGSVDRVHGAHLPKAEYRNAHQSARMVARFHGVYLHRAQRRRAIDRHFPLRTGTGAITLVAVSSSAAAYSSNGAIIAVVNRELTWRRAAAQPQAKVKVEIAAFDPKQSEIRINSLGFETRAALLARGSMIFSAASNDAVIDAYLPAVPVPIRELIEYSYPTQSAFVLARGSAQGPVMMSWSPDGHIVAIVDGDAQASTLTLLAPPR